MKKCMSLVILFAFASIQAAEAPSKKLKKTFDQEKVTEFNNVHSMLRIIDQEMDSAGLANVQKPGDSDYRQFFEDRGGGFMPRATKKGIVFETNNGTPERLLTRWGSICFMYKYPHLKRTQLKENLRRDYGDQEREYVSYVVDRELIGQESLCEYPGALHKVTSALLARRFKNTFGTTRQFGMTHSSRLYFNILGADGKTFSSKPELRNDEPSSTEIADLTQEWQNLSKTFEVEAQKSVESTEQKDDSDSDEVFCDD